MCRQMQYTPAKATCPLTKSPRTHPCQLISILPLPSPSIHSCALRSSRHSLHSLVSLCPRSRLCSHALAARKNKAPCLALTPGPNLRASLTPSIATEPSSPAVSPGPSSTHHSPLTSLPPRPAGLCLFSLPPRSDPNRPSLGTPKNGRPPFLLLFLCVVAHFLSYSPSARSTLASSLAPCNTYVPVPKTAPAVSVRSSQHFVATTETTARKRSDASSASILTRLALLDSLRSVSTIFIRCHARDPSIFI